MSYRYDPHGVTVIVPFWGDDPFRKCNLELVLQFFAANFPHTRLRLSRFESLAQARNRAAKAASELLLFNDADTLCPPDQIIEAVQRATLEPGPVFCMDSYLRLSRATTESLTGWHDAFVAPAEQELHEPPSNGCMAITRASFLELGGYDERFHGWGYEDCEFNLRAERMFGIRRVAGEAVHLWHGERRVDDSPLDEDPARVAANLRLFEAERAR